MAAQDEDVYCTLIMSDAYLPGAAVLAHSLRDAGTTKKLAAMITLDTLGSDTVSELKELYDILIPVERITNPNPGNLFLMDRGDLFYTFTKINLWAQTQFRKIVYLDADMVAVRAVDELFNIEAPFAAAPDIGWPDCFNTGLMVISPNMGDYHALKTLAASGDSFDGADQGLLNQYYEHQPWHRLSYTYNCTPNAEYQWEPAYRHYKSDIKMIHFIGKDKPWTKGRHALSGSGVYRELLGRWWAVYDRHLKPVQQFVPGQTFSAPSTVVRQHVAGEATDAYGGVAPEEHIPLPPPTEIAPVFTQPQAEIPIVTVEPPFAEPPTTQREERREGREEPAHEEVPVPVPVLAPAPQQWQQPPPEPRSFPAPQSQWDATRFAPPPQAHPEAVNFPTQQYEFSESKEFFHPPTSYPEPPKDMYYEIPKEKPQPQERPRPIFPWERDHDMPKPTRVFADDSPPPPLPKIPSTTAAEESATIPPLEPPEILEPVPFIPQPNAWDNVQSIERYVRAVMDAQTRRTKPSARAPEDVVSPPAARPPGRRESLILTDFPTADDRPSLPVTPAPIRRPTFWGSERDDEGNLPVAEGVPDQADWNPDEKLEELRRSSLVEFEHLKAAETAARKLSLRDMPEHSCMPGSDGTHEQPEDVPSLMLPEQVLPTSSTAPGSQIVGLSEPAEGDQPSSQTSPQTSLPLNEHIESADLSPPSQIPPQAGPITTATAEAEIEGQASASGKPVFSEPDFGPIAESIGALRKSPGSFSAESLRGADHLSPTER